MIEKIKTFINAAHGKLTPGKRSPDNSYFEWEGNRKLAAEIAKMIPDSENIVGDSPINISLKQRVEYVNSHYGESIYLSIHSNASTKSGWGKARGHTCFYHKTSKKSKLLAQCISKRLDEFSQLPSRGIKPSSWLYETRKTKQPASLLEIGFHDNKEDLIIIEHDRELHAKAVWLGVEDYKREVKAL